MWLEQLLDDVIVERSLRAEIYLGDFGGELDAVEVKVLVPKVGRDKAPI